MRSGFLASESSEAVQCTVAAPVEEDFRKMFLLSVAVAGLKLKRLKVPAYTVRGESALLECR